MYFVELDSFWRSSCYCNSGRFEIRRILKVAGRYRKKGAATISCRGGELGEKDEEGGVRTGL